MAVFPMGKLFRSHLISRNMADFAIVTIVIRNMVYPLHFSFFRGIAAVPEFNF